MSECNKMEYDEIDAAECVIALSCGANYEIGSEDRWASYAIISCADGRKMRLSAPYPTKLMTDEMEYLKKLAEERIALPDGSPETFPAYELAKVMLCGPISYWEMDEE